MADDPVAKIRSILKDMSTDSTDLPPEEKGTAVDESAEKIVDAVLSRVSHVLTEDDMNQVEQLDKNDTTGDTVKYFILSKCPNFDAIVKEEVENVRLQQALS